MRKDRLPGKIIESKIALALFFAVLALLYTLPIFRHPTWWGAQDWDLNLFYHETPRVTLLTYHQLPLWNPYYMGGTVLLAHPQSRPLFPSFGLVLLFGTEVGLKLDIWLHVFIGLWGAYLLAQYMGLGVAGALTTAFVFALNSSMALHLTVGMTTFLAVAFLPWAFLYFLKSLDKPIYILAAGLVLALMLFDGGIHPLLITLLFLGLYSLLLIAFREYSFRGVALALAGALVFMGGFSAIKLLPMLEFMREFPRLIYDYSGYSLETLVYSLFAHDQTKAAIANLAVEGRGFWTGVTGGMAENGMYIGWLPLVLAMVGVGLHHKKRLILFVTALIFLWLSFGNRPRLELWTLLHLLPGYSSMRIAQRFRLVLGLLLAVLAGFGFETTRRFIERRVPMRYRQLSRRLSLLIPVMILVDLLAVSQPIFSEAFTIPPFQLPRSSQEFTQISGYPDYNAAGWVTVSPKGLVDWSKPLTDEQLFDLYTNPLILYATEGAMFPAIRANLGTIDGYEPVPVPKNAVPSESPAYRGELFLAGSSGQAEFDDWSPNRLRINLTTSQPDYLVINQNFYPGWHATDGRALTNFNGLLAVPVTPDDHQLELYYRPASVVAGSIITLLTVIVAAVIIVKAPQTVLKPNVNLEKQT